MWLQELRRSAETGGRELVCEWHTLGADLAAVLACTALRQMDKAVNIDRKVARETIGWATQELYTPAIRQHLLSRVTLAPTC
jgi:hypothetical protein